MSYPGYVTMLKELGVENVPGDLDEPLELGYYYSYCGIDKWKDTGVRSEVTFCCQGGVSVDCQTLADQEGQLEDQTGQSQGQSQGQSKGKSQGQGQGQGQSSGKNPANSIGIAGSTTDIVAAPSDSGSASNVIDNLKVRQRELSSFH